MFVKNKSIEYKSLEEIEIMKLSGNILGKVHGEISKNIKSGISLKFIDKLAFDFISDCGAIPSFLNYNGFPNSLCISVNQTVVHGIPSNYILNESDIVSIDCGVKFNGFHADSAYTYRVGEIDKNVYKLLKVTYDSLYIGISKLISGNRIGDVGYEIQKNVEANGFTVVTELVGHGVGRELHQSPELPNFGKRGDGKKLINGMVLAIEPMVNMGTKDIVQLDDNWTINTKDGKPSAHFEHTVAINNGNPIIITTFDYIVKEQRIDG